MRSKLGLESTYHWLQINQCVGTADRSAGVGMKHTRFHNQQSVEGFGGLTVVGRSLSHLLA